MQPLRSCRPLLCAARWVNWAGPACFSAGAPPLARRRNCGELQLLPSTFRPRRLSPAAPPLPPSRSQEETEALIEGVRLVGVGKWAEIKKLPLPGVAGMLLARSAVDLKDKWRNLVRGLCGLCRWCDLCVSVCVCYIL